MSNTLHLLAIISYPAVLIWPSVIHHIYEWTDESLSNLHMNLFQFSRE